MIGTKMADALNRHIHEETYSAYLYLAMSAWCESKAFKGFARWLRIQHGEELAHARKSLDYLLARGGLAALRAIEAPPASFGMPLQMFEAVLEHERKVTRMIEELLAVATAEHDAAAQVFLQWYVAEQVEEEARAQEIVDKLRMVGDRMSTVLYLDKEYGKRTPSGSAAS
jgi:ferritin